jgi:tetratricopeptide (TPR) repeat protein
MGALYLARDPGLDRLVAIKLLRDDFQDDPELRERFIREARSVARLRHQNIVVVHEFGEDEGRPFMAMEYIAGETLTRVLRREPPLPLSKRLSLVEELCAGLSHAHAAGVIHRDIKPSNIMLDGDGVLKILDFGIARLINSGMTRDGMMMGSVNYMSPEQIVGRGVDQRTDIFATGAVLYEVLALEQAFPGGPDSGVLNRILYEGPVPLAERVPDIDPELAAIVARALERDPALRHRDASELRREIASVRRRLPDAHERLTLDRNRTLVERGASEGQRRESDRPRRLDPARFAELKRQQVEEHLRLAEDAFARGDHEAAIQYAERAATVDPDSRAAFDVIDRVRFAIEAKAVRQKLALAQRLLADGRMDEAASLADEASVTILDAPGAVVLQAEVREIAERIAAAREREREINASLDRARSSLERGEHETALRAVYEVLAVDPERVEAHELEQQAKAGLLARREHDRARQAAADRLRQALALAEEGRFEEAIDVVSSVIAPSDTVRVEVDEALATIRRRQQEAAHAAIIATAQTAFGQGRLDEALAVLETLPSDVQDTTARGLRVSIDEALRERRELERKRRVLDASIASVGALLDGGDLTRASEELEHAARIGLQDARLAALGQRLAELDAALQERRRQEARDRVAAKRVDAARQMLAGGDARAALALLQRDESGHHLVQQALREIGAVVAEEEERARLEAERKRKEEEARRLAAIEAERQREEQRRIEEARRREEERLRRRQQVLDLLGVADQELAAHRPDEAARILRQAERFGLLKGDEELAHRAQQIGLEAERQTRAQEEARRQEEERRQAELRRQEAERVRREEEARRQEAERVRREEEARQQAAADAARREEEARQQAAAEAAQREEEARRQAAAEATRREEEARRQATAEAARREEEARRQAAAEAAQREEEARRQAAAEAARREEEARRKAEAEAARVREEQRRAEERRQAEEARQRQEEARRREEARRAEEAARRAEEEARRAAEAAQRAEKERLEREAEARRREAEARRKEEQLATIFSKAQEASEHELALTILREAQTLAPNDSRVLTLVRERSEALEAQRRAAEARAAAEAAQREREAQRARDEAAAAAVDRAQQLFDAGQHEEAIALLRGVPVHTRTKTALDTLQARRARIEEERAREARARRRLERRAAVAAALRKTVADPRVHMGLAALLLVAIAGTAWRFRPAPSAEPPAAPTPGVAAPGNTEPAPPPAGGATPAPPAPGPEAAPVSPGPGAPIAPAPATPIAPAPAPARGRGDLAGAPAGGGPGAARGGNPPAAPPAAPSTPVELPTPVPTPPSAGSPSPVPAATPQTPPQPPIAAPVPAPPVAPTPSPAPPPPPPAPIGPNLDAERAAIGQVLAQYVAAYSRMDEGRLREIDPAFRTIPSRLLLREVTLTPSDLDLRVSADGQSATLSATANFSYVWNRSGFPPRSTGQLRWNLRKAGGTWRVVP